jgi:SAM-dependent methyltransferase
MGIPIREVPVRYDSRCIKEGKKLRWTDGFEALYALWRWRKWSPQPGHRPAVKESIMKSNNPQASVPGSPAPTGWKALVKRTLRSRVGRSILRVAGCIPLGRAMFNMVYDPQTGFHAGTGDMQRDWDDRARANAQYFIAVDGAGNDGEFWESGVRELNQLILPGLELSPDMKALEVGCGIGRLARPLSRIVQEVHGVDISAEMVHRGTECLSGIPNVQLHHTTGDLKMFADASFDFCYSYRVFQHIPRKELVWQYWNEVARILKPDGLFRFQICLAGRSSRRPRGGTWFGALPTADELQSVLPASGFEILSITDEPSSNERLWDSKIITCRRHSLSQEAS